MRKDFESKELGKIHRADLSEASSLIDAEIHEKMGSFQKLWVHGEK